MREDDRQPGRIPLAAIGLLACLLCALAPAGGFAEAAQPSPSALSVRIAGGDEAPLLLDEEAIKALPQRSFTTLDPWDGKIHEFSGVLLSVLLEKAGAPAQAAKITVTARNKYTIPIRRSDCEKYGYLLAWKMDGRPFGDDKATRNRGFASIAIDFTGRPELDPELYKHQLVWQVSEIVVE